MFITKMSLPRRTFLRGVGATLALPLLEAMVPALTPAAKAAGVTRRLAFVYVPHGVIMDDWTPKTDAAGLELTPILKPLEPFRDSLTVVTNLGRPGENDHATSAAAWLSGAAAKRTEAEDVYLGTTIDQIVARQIGEDTSFPSLELATEDFTGYVGGCSPGYSCAYMNTLCWTSPTTPLPMEINPRVVFERLFGRAGTAAQRLERLEDDRSILDSISADLADLERRVGARDRVRIGEYLDHVREIERRIQHTETQSRTQAVGIDAPIGVPESYSEHAGLMFELMSVAFQADLTRVATFMMARELSNKTYPEAGVNQPHHTISHHGNKPELIALHARLNTFHVSLFGRFLDRLRNTPDGEGSLLDHSLVFYGSGMSNGNGHTADPLPLLAIGGGIKGGRQIQNTPRTHLGNLWLGVAGRFGCPVEQVGESNAALDL